MFRVGLTSRTTLRTLNRMIREFYGHPAPSAPAPPSFAVDCVLSCQTRIGVVDDLHFVDPHRGDGIDVANHLKWLADELPISSCSPGWGLPNGGCSPKA